MHSYEMNKHGKIVFPSNCFPDLDFSTFDSLEQLDAVVRRDFDSKAPTGTDILEGIKTGSYQSKFELMRDMALNLFWANRFKITMYDVRPTRWADVPRRRDDIFIPIQTPWEDRETKVTAVQSAYPGLPPLQLPRDHRLQLGCGRAGGATPLVDGLAQSVSVVS